MPPLPSAPLNDSLTPGSYDVCFCATSGSRKGRCITASLWLARPSARDRSPRSGKLADDSRQRGLLLYGALERFDPGAVGAPIRPTAVAGSRAASKPSAPRIAPSSRDPVFPGVLVSRGDVPAADGTRVASVHLLVAAPGNARDGSTWLDGSGMVMFVRRLDSRGFDGVWGASGVVSDGSGVFHARRRGAAGSAP